MAYFLAKTEPSTYSIEDLKKEHETLWDGVHNHQAIAYIKTMQPGDTVFIYHSVKEKRVVGVAEVIGEPFENKDDERFSWAVRFRFVRLCDGPSLADFKANPLCKDFKLVTNSRLSTMSVPDDIAAWICGQ